MVAIYEIDECGPESGWLVWPTEHDWRHELRNGNRRCSCCAPEMVEGRCDPACVVAGSMIVMLIADTPAR
jgi:hypothetical protein